MTFSVDAGAGMSFESSEILGEKNSGALKAGQAFDWNISKTSKLTERIGALWKTDDFDDSLYHFDAGITTTIAAADA